MEGLLNKNRLTVTVTVATIPTVEVETFVTMEVGVGMFRQSQALENSDEATDGSHVGIGGLELR